MILLSSFKKKHVLEIGMFLWLFLFFHIMDVMKDSKTKKKTFTILGCSTLKLEWWKRIDFR